MFGGYAPGAPPPLVPLVHIIILIRYFTMIKIIQDIPECDVNNLKQARETDIVLLQLDPKTWICMWYYFCVPYVAKRRPYDSLVGYQMTPITMTSSNLQKVSYIYHLSFKYAICSKLMYYFFHVAIPVTLNLAPGYLIKCAYYCSCKRCTCRGGLASAKVYP